MKTLFSLSPKSGKVEVATSLGTTLGTPQGLPASTPIQSQRAGGQPVLTKAGRTAPAGLSLPTEASLSTAFVDGEEGQTTRRLVEQSEKADIEIREQRRVFRLLVWLALLLLSYGGWKLFNIGSTTVVTTQRYDPAVGVDLEVLGCDVDFVPGDQPTVSFAALLKASHAQWRKRSDAPVLRYAHLANSEGCGRLRPGSGCRRRCLVTVTVPSDAAATAAFRIDQDSEDLETPTITVAPKATVARLAISPRRVPRALNLVVDHASLTTSLTAQLGFGVAQVRESSIPSDASLVTVYSIYMVGLSTISRSGEARPLGSACEAYGMEVVDEVAALGGLQSTGEGEIVLTSPGFVPLAASHATNRGDADARDDGDDDDMLPEPKPVLSPTDADRLSKAYGAEYGDRDSTGAGYLVFDVVGSVGVPTARFVCA
jgi:hypothetical protein